MIPVEDTLSDLPAFGVENPRARNADNPGPDVELEPTPTEFKPNEILGIRRPQAYNSEPLNNTQRILRHIPDSDGDEWKYTDTISDHVTPGFSKNHAVRYNEEISDMPEDDEYFPTYPPRVKHQISDHPNSSKTQAQKDLWWGRIDPNGLVTPLRTTHIPDGSHGPRRHWDQARIYRFGSRRACRFSCSLCAIKAIGNLRRAIAREINAVFADQLENSSTRSFEVAYALSRKYRRDTPARLRRSKSMRKIFGYEDSDLDEM